MAGHQRDAGLTLEARGYTNETSWRWVLTDSGTAIAEHKVALDRQDWQFEALGDLPGWVSWHAAPDTRPQDEARIVAEVGDWIATSVLGPVAAALASRARRQPVTVRVLVPAQATELAFRPLELAHVNGKALAVQGVTLVTQIGADGTTTASTTTGDHRPDPVGDRLRVLGLFSLPEGGQALNLRRERHALVGLIRGLAREGRAADIRVLQYGVTRESLRDVLDEDEGWDVIHISGHGAPGTLVLETAAGQPDPVDAATLADLLGAARGRLKLVTVAACWSAATSAAEQRRLLGLQLQSPPDTKRLRSPAAPQPPSDALATELTRLGCAVLAMRYPVDDEFAIALTEKLYGLVADKAQPLPKALGTALRDLAADPDRSYPPLSVATPALFGAAAADLRLTAPARAGADDYTPAHLKLPGFPPQPDRFVGRTGVMTRASAALARKSRVPGVLLHGMPGGGKTACAVELAYNHEHAFDRLVWYKAPDDGADITGSLTDFALTLERNLPGFQMAHLVGNAGQLAGFLPVLTEVMERFRLLIIIDNAESLLTESGQWRDDNWGTVIDALLGHNGLGRLILTSRRVPAGLMGQQAEMLSVDALSPDEALLLARELPDLRRLIYGELPGIDHETSRRLAFGVLNVAQGHPKLLELANGQAGHPEALGVLVEAGDQAWREQGGLPDGFFTSAEAPAAARDYWHVLAAWTNAVTDTLEPGERDLFWFLCCLEEPDRERQVLENNWADLRQRLGRDGEPPGLDRALAAVAATGLAALRPEADDTGESYAIHPGVSKAGRDQAGMLFRNTADTEAAAFWTAVYWQASGDAGDGTVHTGLQVRAGLASVPYLIRQKEWTAAAALLEGTFLRSPSRATAAAMLPAIQQATHHDPRLGSVLALVLEALDPAAAEAAARDALDTAMAAGDDRTASGLAGRLAYLCLDSGRLAEALDFAERKIGYTRQAGLGPWTQLADEGWRLQVLNEMGQADHVLAEVARLQENMATLPVALGSEEMVTPWNVREALLDTGREAALKLGRWDDALDLNETQVASMRDRSAPISRIAGTQFNDYGPLLRLGRTGQALALLQDCLRAFRDAHDLGMIGKTLSALADTEDERGHADAAIRLERDALRYGYLVSDVPGIAVRYHNLGHFLRDDALQLGQALASHLAAALIRTLIGVGGDSIGSAQDSVQNVAIDLREFGTLPATVADLDRQLGDIPGTDLPALIAKLCPDPETAEATLRDLVAQARALAAAPQKAAPAQSPARRRWWRRR